MSGIEESETETEGWMDTKGKGEGGGGQIVVCMFVRLLALSVCDYHSIRHK